MNGFLRNVRDVSYKVLQVFAGLLQVCCVYDDLHQLQHTKATVNTDHACAGLLDFQEAQSLLPVFLCTVSA